MFKEQVRKLEDNISYEQINDLFDISEIDSWKDSNIVFAVSKEEYIDRKKCNYSDGSRSKQCFEDLN